MWASCHNSKLAIFQTSKFHSSWCRLQSTLRSQEKRRNFLAYGTAAVAGIISVWWVKRTRPKKVEDKGKIILIDKDMGKFVKYKGCLLPDQVFQVMPKVEKFQIRPDDVLVVSFPKSGTTWVQEIVYLLMNGADFVMAKEKNLEDRFPFLEYPCPGLDQVDKMESPRLIKTHLPINLLPKQVASIHPKIIYIARNPRDVTVSFFHFCKSITFLAFKGSFEDFFEKFVSGKVPYAPWSSHVKSFWDQRDDDNILFITYEELHKDIIGSIRKIANFLGQDICDEDLRRIAVFCSFSYMKSNKTSNYSWLEETGLKGKEEAFMRKGKVGDWKNYFTDEMRQRMDNMANEEFSQQNLFTYEDG